jgi:hypothetical protein
MEFTPQQLAGAGKYSASVRIGNWNEDRALREIKGRAHASAARGGLGLGAQARARTGAGREAARLGAAGEGGLVPVGGALALRHGALGRCLAANPHCAADGQLPGLALFACAGAEGAPSLRSTFQVLAAPGAAPKAFVEFGDEVLLATHPRLRVSAESGLAQSPLFLMSAGALLGGSASGQQEARLAQVTTGAQQRLLRWRFERPSGAELPLGADRRVRVSEPVTLVHCSTGKALALDAAIMTYSDHGAELDAFCCLEHRAHKTQVLRREHAGLRTPAERVPVGDRNHWEIVMLAPGEAAQDEPCAVIQPDTVLEWISSQLEAQGPEAKQRLAAILDGADRARDGALDAVELQYCLVDAGLRLSLDEFNCLFSCLESNGAISIADLLQLL